MIIHDLMFDVIMVIGIGSSSAISTSKIMKITAIRKNRDENGSRAASSVHYTTSCKHSLALPRMGEIIARNRLS